MPRINIKPKTMEILGHVMVAYSASRSRCLEDPTFLKAAAIATLAVLSDIIKDDPDGFERFLSENVIPIQQEASRLMRNGATPEEAAIILRNTTKEDSK